MCKTVIKRDGRRVVFDPSKIQNAIIKAMVATNNGVDQGLCSAIAYQLYNYSAEELSVEEIQDMVESKLMESERKDVAKQYIAYRHQRSLKRNEKINDVYKSIVDAENNEITRENANMNADTPAGMMMKFASEATKQFVDDYLLSPEAQEAVRNNYIHIHDKDYYPTRSFTCVQHPLDKILSKGFVAGHGESRPAKRIETASILGCISMETVQNEMHGGQAIPAFDFYMAPYVRKAFEEEVRKGAKFYNISEDDLNQMLSTEVDDYITRDTDNLVGCRGFIIQNAINETVERVHQAMEAFVHNMNTIHSRGGNQVVFSSLNYGTDTSPEGRCVIRELLTTTYKGIGGGATAIFPIQIWKKKRGVNYLPGDPNYDLYELACAVSARRFFPNFVNLDATYNFHEDWKADDPNRYQYEVATMGCFAKDTPMIMSDGTKKPVQEVVVGDLLMGDDGTPRKVLELIRGKDKLYQINQKHAEPYIVNGQHILSLKWTISKRVRGWNYGDTVNITVEDYLKLPYSTRRHLKGYKSGYELEEKEFRIDPYILGLWLGDGVRDRTTILVNKSESVLIDHLRSFASSIGAEVSIRDRGSYYDCNIITGRKENEFYNGLVHYGLLKNKHIPEEYLTGSRRQRSALLAGLINTDGWARKGRGRSMVCFGNTNFDLISKAKSLADSLGYSTNVILARAAHRGIANHTEHDLKDYWHLSIQGFDDPLLMENKRTDLVSKRNFSLSEITVEEIGEGDFFGFELDGNQLHQFNDGTVTHNCRTRTFENRFGPKTAIGRGNLSFTTINLPKIALECMHIKDLEKRKIEFNTKLRIVMDVAAKQLHERFVFQSKALKKQFPLLMSGLWLGSENLGENDTVESVINQGTLAIGFIGLAEALIALVGKHHGESDDAQELGLEIITYMRDLSIRYSDVYKHNYSIIATPAESVSGKFIKKDKVQFGSIPGVTDKEYYTNSNHIPVYYHCTAQHKAQIEGPYHNLTRGGHIFYVEIDGDATHNPEAIKTVVDLMDRYNIGYGSVNHNRNRCMDCGYENADRDIKCCPKCGSERIDKLCRITGYLVGSTERWNAAKLAELNDRVVHGNTSTKRCK